MKIIFLIETFYPFGGSTALIAKNIIEEYRNKNECKVYSFYTPKSSYNYMYSVKNLYNFFLYKFFKLFSRFFLNNFEPLFMANILRKIKKEKPDLVISFIGNYRLFKLAYEIKQKLNYDNIIILTDPFLNNINLLKYNKVFIFNSYLEFTKSAKKILLPKEYKTEVNESIKEKFFFYKFPLLVDTSNLRKPSFQKNKEYIFIYTGTFYKTFRNPAKVLNLFLKLNGTIKFKLLVLGPINPFIFIPKYEHNLFKSFLVYLGNKDQETTFSYLKIADAFINIGNINSIQFPGKMISYLSFNKKIISFSDSYMDFEHPHICYIKSNIIFDDFYKTISKFMYSNNNVNFNSLAEFYQAKFTIDTLDIY
jgi:hypothetical protein